MPTEDDADDGIDSPFDDGVQGDDDDVAFNTTTATAPAVTVNPALTGPATSNNGSNTGNKKGGGKRNRNGQGLPGRLRRMRHPASGNGGEDGRGARAVGVDHCSVLIKVKTETPLPPLSLLLSLSLTHKLSLFSLTLSFSLTFSLPHLSPFLPCLALHGFCAGGTQGGQQ